MGWDLIVGQTRYGRGVFATRRYEQGDEVETCPTLQVPEDEISGLLSDYVFKSVDDDQVLVLLGYGSLYNHSSKPNLEYVQDDPQTVTFLASRTIEPGDELTIDYGEEWWELRELQPD